MDDYSRRGGQQYVNGPSNSIHSWSFTDETPYTSARSNSSFISATSQPLKDKAPADSLPSLTTKMSSNLALGTGKRKWVEVIDLTGDSDRPTGSQSSTISGNDFPRRLHTQSDGGRVQLSHRPISGTQSHGTGPTPSMHNRTQQEKEDEVFARKLQAELNGINSAHFDPFPRLYDDHGDDGDAAYARQLQAEYDEERLVASAQFPGHLHPSAASAGFKPSFNPAKNHSNDDDAAYARELQAEYDEERLLASASCREDPESSAATADLENHNKALVRFADAVRHVACAECKSPCLPSENALLLRFKQWFEEGAAVSMALSSIVTCEKRSCSAKTCLGCGSLWKNGAYFATVLPDETTVQWCCSRGRLALLWLLLCGHDRRRTSSIRRDSFFKKSNKPEWDSGVGFDASSLWEGFPISDSPSLSGSAWTNPCKNKYGTSQTEGASQVESVFRGPSAPSPPQILDYEDRLTLRLMRALAVLLPSLTAADGFDVDPPAVLTILLTQCSFLDSIATILRNDSLENATAKLPLYNSTLDVVSKLGNHHATANATIYCKRRVQESGPDVLSRSFGSNGISGANFDEKQPLADCLHNIDKQSKSILRHAQAHAEAFSGPENQNMLLLCQRVSDLTDHLLANKSMNVTGPAPESKENWQADMAVLELPDDCIMRRHHYASKAAEVQNLAVNRMKSLSLQMSNLMTSLPPGIFIRHGTSRLDLTKILIVGPEGTPYENGLFEFDLFCSSGFPNEPPLMNLRTTGGGTVRFNPNLYNCGKVCLSLLGTWSGEPWQPGKSTILQVLVSIQAMIFCDEPWYNEPGRGTPDKATYGKDASNRYNREIQGHTVRHAMINWLENANLDPVWGEVILKHFSHNGDKILRTIERWGVDYSLRSQFRKRLFDLPTAGKNGSAVWKS